MGTVLLLAAVSGLRADVLEMQNGDRYSGQVLAVTAGAVVLNSEILGKITVPRAKVARLAFGTNGLTQAPAGAPVASLIITNPPRPALPGTNPALSAAFLQLGADTNVISAIRQQMFAGNPQGAAKYDEMVNGLMSGQMNVADLRRQAKASADQLRELKKGLGPDVDDAVDVYLKILDTFVNESANEPDSR